MARRNYAHGGGKKLKAEIQGLKELEAKLRKLKMDHPEAAKEIYDVVGGVCNELRDSMKAAARSAGWAGERTRTNKKGVTTTKKVSLRRVDSGGKTITGQDAINSIFSFAEQQSGSVKHKISGLVGVGKRKTMIEWRAGKHPKSPRAQVQAGNMVAMAFATMLEFGTSTQRARPAIRKAINSARSMMIDKLASGYRALIEKYSK